MAVKLNFDIDEKSVSIKGYAIDAPKITGMLIKKENLAAFTLSVPKKT